MQPLDIAQVIIGSLLMIAILVQHKSAGVASVFGGEGAISFQKRGPERILHMFTVLLALSFVVISTMVVIR